MSIRRFIKKCKRQGTLLICLMFALIWLVTIMAIIVPGITPADVSEANFLPENAEKRQLSESALQLTVPQPSAAFHLLIDHKNLTIPLSLRLQPLGHLSESLKSIRNVKRSNRWRRLLLLRKRWPRASAEDSGSGLPEMSTLATNSWSDLSSAEVALWTSAQDSSAITMAIDEATIDNISENVTVIDDTTIPTTATTTADICDRGIPPPLKVFFPPSHVKEHSLRVRWDLPEDISRYNIKVHVDLFEKSENINYEVSQGKVVTFEDLKPCTEYKAQVRILSDVCRRGSRIVSNTIKTRISKKRQNVSVKCDATSAKINWTDISDQCEEVAFSILQIQLSSPQSNKNYTYNYTDGSHQIDNLSPYTSYSFEVKFLDPLNMTVTKTCKTLPAAPDRVNNLTVNCSSLRRVANLSWYPPTTIKGELEKYVINSKVSKREGVCHAVMSSETFDTLNTTFMKRSLCAESTYTFVVYAKNKEVETHGKARNISCKTDARVPPKCNAAFSLSLEPNNNTQIEVGFNRSMFSNENGLIRRYAIIIAESKCNDHQRQGYQNKILPDGRDNITCDGGPPMVKTPKSWNPFNASKDSEFRIIGGLSPATNYSVKIRAFNAVGFTDSMVVYIMTDPNQVTLDTQNSFALVISILVLILVISCAALLLYVLRRKKDVLKTIQSIRKMKCGSQPLHLTAIPVKVTSKPVPVADFEEHYRTMSSDSSLKFSMEFEELTGSSPTCPITAAKLNENRPKNRWVNILPFDHSRVKLLPIADDVSTDYINASYIPGYSSKREFIASQGPLPCTTDDFWRMVWEQNSQMIAMVTQCVERGKNKCAQYWPTDNEMHHYGDLGVRLKSESVLNGYTLRIFELQLRMPSETQIRCSTLVDVSDCMELIPGSPEIDKGLRTLEVKQMHFTTWPDFGCPESTSLLLNFIRSVRDHMPRDPSGPIVVHCSAGVGRTGTYIAVDKIMQHVNDHDFVDVYATVREMRHYRTNMVQTEDQYVYIHECIKDYLIERQSLRQSVYCETGDTVIYSNIAYEKQSSVESSQEKNGVQTTEML